MKKGLLLFVFLVSFGANAQQNWHRLSLESQYGWIIPHNSELKQISSSNPFSIGFSSHWMRTTRKNWDACHCFHYLGLNFSLVDYQNPHELGQAWNLSGTFEPILHRTDSFIFSLSTGLGVSYLTRVFDPIENPRNTFFSAPISFLLTLAPKAIYNLNNHWALQASMSYHHISNGGQRQPNRGMNFPMLGLGIVHFTRKSDLPDYEKKSTSNRWNFYTDLAMNTRESTEKTRRPNLVLSVGTFRKISGIIGLGGGLEVARDFSLPVQERRIESLISGMYLENHFLFGRFDFSQRFGKYLHKPEEYLPNEDFFQRYTLTYLMGNHFAIGAGLKVHGHVAEYLDLRVGWKF
ncbi:acyloxyacyl hydrolase [Algoriphagus aquatilis]|uniref:Acyloxyacyl hydrolase n=1 Tax=Algoriphagus aquatilis TaxID=490186 RepID=A0ABW0BSC6_9BACT